MDKKILVIMAVLVVVAVVVVAAIMVASGGLAGTGGFTKLFNKLVNDDEFDYNQRLALPADWESGDVKKVSDTIIDLYGHEEDHGYSTVIWFAYHGDKWNNPIHGTHFMVPDTSGDGWLVVDHGVFTISIWSATNITAKYDVGDTITVQTTLKTNTNADLAFDDEWSLSGIL